MKATLTNENINNACEEAGAFLKARGCDSKELVRVKFSIEDVLLRYQKLLGKDAEFILETGGGFSKRKIRLTVRGPEHDPFANSEYTTEEDLFIRNALALMGKHAKWRYRRGSNEILYTLSKKRLPGWVSLLIAIVSAIILGVLVRYIPPEAATVLRDGIIAPLLSTFLGFLNAVAGPMIFLSVVWGIYSIGDVSTFSEVGKKLSIIFGIFICAMTVVIAVASLSFFSLSFGHSSAGSDFSSLYRMVLDIIPNNLFTPFSRGNTLQILFVAVIIGVAMLLIAKNTQTVADLAEELGYIVNGIMNVVSMMVPSFVFGSLFVIVASSDFGSLKAGGKFFFGAALGCAALIVLHTLVTCITCKMSPAVLWKATFSTFIISITTASSSAAFADNIRVCTDNLHINKRLVNFGVPFGQILYKPAVAVLFWFAAISSAESGHVEISASWIVIAIFMCIVVSAAAPPVPGGMSASFTILFSQLDLPTANLAVILSLTSILDFLVTAANIYSAQCVLKVSSGDM